MPIYSDLNQYDPTSKPLLEDVEAIYSSIDTILSSLKSQSLFKPEFPGESLEDILFEIIDDITSVEIFRIVTTVVERWEPRVKIINKLTEVTPVPEENKYELLLVFKILGFGTQHFEVKGNITK